MVTQPFLFVWQEVHQIREQSEGSEKDFTSLDAAACTDCRLHTADSSAVLCSQPKKGGLVRQAHIEQHNQGQLHDPWICLLDSSPEQLPKSHHQYPHRHAADTIKHLNVHTKHFTMSDENDCTELSEDAKNDTSEPLPDITPSQSQISSESKKAPPVAPKPSWFRQSLRKIQDEKDQKKSSNPEEQTPTLGFNKMYRARVASPAASTSIKQKIHSFETFSCPDGPEKVGNRRSVTHKEIPLKKSTLVRERDHTASPSVSTSSEVCSQTTGKPFEEEPSFVQSLTELPSSNTISTDLDSRENNFQSTPVQEDTENVDLSGSIESTQHSQSVCMAVSAAPPEDSNSLRGLEGESIEKILAFSNQVSQALLHSLPAQPCHCDPSAVHVTNPQEASADKGFSLSLATLRECTIERGEGASTGEVGVTSTCAQSVISAIPSEEIQKMIQEVKVLDEETLKQLVDIQVVILHKEEGTGLGFNIAGGCDLENKALTVHRVFPSGLAAQEGTIQKGDEVLSINGQTLHGITHADATAALRQARSLKLAVVVICKRAKEEGREGGRQTEDPSPTAEVKGAPVSVELEKEAGGVGFTLEGGKGSINGDKPLVINRIFKEHSDLQSGDELLQIQGVSLQDMTRFEAWNMIKALPEGPITAVIRRREGKTQ